MKRIKRIIKLYPEGNLCEKEKTTKREKKMESS